MGNDAMQLFEDQPIRSAWDAEREEWYFSVVDVVGALTGSENPRRYWSDLKRKLKSEGAVELYENIVQLKLKSTDGKKRLTDVADTEQLLRIIQSIPSPKAEPFKLWLAQVGRERIEETIDPEQAIDRALETYLKKGYSEEWVHQRLLAIRIRNELTDEWSKRGVQKGREYAILTDEISRAWSGMTTRQYKDLKGLKKENLRDNMSDLELVLEYAGRGEHDGHLAGRKARGHGRKPERSPTRRPRRRQREKRAGTGDGPPCHQRRERQDDEARDGHHRGRGGAGGKGRGMNNVLGPACILGKT